ncbi:MAG: helix-turn-helix domain-containing protein [Solirubrobacteraceae bacterium]
MTTVSHTVAPANVCWVLREDPELAEAIESSRRSQAMEALIAREVRIPRGAWAGRTIPIDDGIGLLVLEGVMLHRVGIDGRFGAELVGEGDVLRAVHQDLDNATLPLTVEWLILEPSRVAVLDERFVRQLARFPQVAGRLFARSVLRSRSLAVNMAIVHQARVDVRLHLLFWQLAGRWGRVRSDGVLLPLRLTHMVLADLVAARRPTVTSALSDLSRRGLVRAVADGWLLSGPSPGTRSS